MYNVNIKILYTEEEGDMRKRLSYLLVVAVFVSMLSLSGCGGGGGGGTTKSEANPYEGKWVAVVAEAMGVQLPIEECFEGDLSFELNSGGKVVFHADEETGNGKWAVADNKLTITIQGEEMVADVGENTFTFDDLMDMGLKVIFGKEGTDATNPENYLTEDELALIGDWHSETVEELLGDGYIIAPAGNLIPERNTSVNVGMLFDLTGKSPSNLQIEVNGFYMYLQNMIRFTGGFLQSQYQNFGEMRTFGVEAEVKADVTRWLYGYVNATYQDLRDTRKYEQNTTVANPTKGSRMPNIPYLMANAGVEFHKENLFGGKGMNTRIFSDASFVEEYLYDFEQSQFQQHRIPRTISCSMGFEQSFGNGRYFIMGNISNLTDTQIISEFNRPLPGRSFTVRFRYVFK